MNIVRIYSVSGKDDEYISVHLSTKVDSLKHPLIEFIEPDYVGVTVAVINDIYNNISTDKDIIKKILTWIDYIDGYGNDKYTEEYIEHSSNFEDAWMIYEKFKYCSSNKKCYFFGSGDLCSKSKELYNFLYGLIPETEYTPRILRNYMRTKNIQTIEHNKKIKSKVYMDWNFDQIDRKGFESNSEQKSRLSAYKHVTNEEYAWKMAHDKLFADHIIYDDKHDVLCFKNKSILLNMVNNDDKLRNNIDKCSKTTQDRYSWWLATCSSVDFADNNKYTIGESIVDPHNGINHPPINLKVPKTNQQRCILYLMYIYAYEEDADKIEGYDHKYKRMIAWYYYYLCHLDVSAFKICELSVANIVKYLYKDNFKFTNVDSMYQYEFDRLIEKYC